jgi:hypothetical protein
VYLHGVVSVPSLEISKIVNSLVWAFLIERLFTVKLLAVVMSGLGLARLSEVEGEMRSGYKAIRLKSALMSFERLS